jgi:hypothetical protein
MDYSRTVRRVQVTLKLAQRDAHGLIRGLKYIQRNDWAWIHFKVSIGILCPLMAWLNPPAVTRTGLVSAWVMNMILIMLLVGGLLSIVGLLLRGTRIRPLIVGYAFEMAGLIPLIAGPSLLALTYVVSSMTGAGPSSLVGFAFCYSLAAALIARYVDTLLHHLIAKKKAKADGEGA